MKLLLHRVLPLLAAILVCSALSWAAIYAFWFGVWIFHNVAAARACAAAGDFFLAPAHFVFTRLGGDQSALFFDPNSYSITNGLILGVLACEIGRRLLARRRRPAVPTAVPPPRPTVVQTR